MEKQQKEKKLKNKDTLHYIKKCWLPLTLTILILVNITLIPNLLNNPNIKINDMSFLLTSTTNSPEITVPIIPSPVIIQEDVIPVQESFTPIENNKPESPELSPNSRSKHIQNSGFRFGLFLLVVFICVLIFMIILSKEQGVFEYSMQKSETIYKDYNKLPRNSYELDDNI